MALYCLLFLTPLIVLPISYSSFELPKVVFAEIVIAGLFFFSVVGKGFTFKKSDPRLLKILASIVIISLVSLIMSPKNSFFGDAFRLQGVFFLWHMLGLTFISSLISTKKVPVIFPALTLAGLVLSAFILGVNQAQRTIGSLGEPNSLAGSAVFLLLLIWFRVKSYLLKGLALIAGLFLIYATGSRSAVIALSIAALFSLLVNLKLEIKRAFFICLIMAIFSLGLVFFDRGQLFENRLEIYKTAVMAGLKKPLFGWGFSNIQMALKETSYQMKNNVQYLTIDSAHNLFLDIWVQMGALGIILFSTLIIFSISGLINTDNPQPLLALFLVSLIPMLFNPLSVVNAIYFWWVIGQGFKKS